MIAKLEPVHLFYDYVKVLRIKLYNRLEKDVEKSGIKLIVPLN